MKKSLIVSLGIFLSLVSTNSLMAGCWLVSDIQHVEASSEDRYRLNVVDSASEELVVCFSGMEGDVTGSNLNFTRLGPSTLVGVSYWDSGHTVVSTYQLDREIGKMLITRSESGRDRFFSPNRSGHVSVRVGVAKPIIAEH